MEMVFFVLGLVGVVAGVVGFASDAVSALNEIAGAGLITAGAVFLVGSTLTSRLSNIEHMMILASRDKAPEDR